MFRRGILIPALLSGIFMPIVSCSPYTLREYFPGSGDTTTVRVLILKTKDRFTVSSDGEMSASIASIHMTRTIKGTSAECTPDSLPARSSIKSGTPPLYLNGKPYRGMFELHHKNGFAYVVNTLKIDEYLMGVVPCEIPSGWESEALKAQAVAARTFAYYHLTENSKSPTLYDLDATTNSQVYGGMSEEKERTSRAVAETSGEIISYNARPILSYFHSTCGGKTIDDKYVWSQSHLEYLKGVTCGFCGDSTKYNWESTLSLEEIRSGLSKKYGKLGKIKNISFKKNNDRVTSVVIRHSRGTLAIPGNNFRLLFPPEKMRSLYFTSKKAGKGFVLSGHGWGHGVGMCQWGARGMALHGYGYQDILKHYYTGVSISPIRDSTIAYKSRK